MRDKYPQDWSQRRMRTFVRDKFECQGCGYEDETKQGAGLEAHHIQPIHDGGSHELENLITLCQECHVDTHRANDESPASPIEKVSCARDECEQVYIKRRGKRGSFCSEGCFRLFKADKILNNVDTDLSICSTCFQTTERHVKTCPNCENWDLSQDNFEALQPNHINRHQLVVKVLESIKYFQQD